MFDQKKVLTEAWEWCNSAVIAIPIGIALGIGIAGEIDGSDCVVDHIQGGIDRATITPIETRPLTNNEVFAYQL